MSDSTSLRCIDAEPYLSVLADGELAEPLRSAVAAHAASCEHCGDILARHRAVNGLFAALPASSPSPAVLDHILAATTVSEPAQRESLRRRAGTPRARRLVTLLTIPRIEPRPALALPRQRSFWQATALPALVAILLISFAFAAFSRVSPNLLGGQTPHGPTPALRGDAYQQAQAAVAVAVAGHSIGYTPEIPWSLPQGATFQHASIDPASGTLDMVWSLIGSLAQLHVREAPVSLADWKDYLLLTGSLALAWQLPGKAAWRIGSSTSDPARLAVVQDDGAHSAAVDIAFPDGVSVSQISVNTQTQAANVLRLASLSMDSTRSTPPAHVTPDAQSTAIHYIAQSGSDANRVESDAYVDPVGNRASVVVSDTQGVLYKDLISGTNDTRYDARQHVYGLLSKLSTPLGDVPLDQRTVNFFSLANSYLADGELWYVGKATWHSHSAYEFALTTAPYRTIVYVDVSSNHILGAEVRYTVAQNAGAVGLISYFAHNACLSYTSVEYLSSVPSDAFTPPQGYRAGTPPTSVTCPT